MNVCCRLIYSFILLLYCLNYVHTKVIPESLAKSQSTNVDENDLDVDRHTANFKSTVDNSTSDQQPPRYWQAILGDICQLPGFPRATADPTRYLECVRQNLATDRKDLGIWTLRDCVEGFHFVAAARRCKSIRSIKRQETICLSSKSTEYDFCPSDSADEFEIHEKRSEPRRCSCPDGKEDCLCARPEILEPVKVMRRTRTTQPAIFVDDKAAEVDESETENGVTPALRFQSFQTNTGMQRCQQPCNRGNNRCCQSSTCTCPTTRTSSTRQQMTPFTQRPPSQQLPTPNNEPPFQPFQQPPPNFRNEQNNRNENFNDGNDGQSTNQNSFNEPQQSNGNSGYTNGPPSSQQSNGNNDRNSSPQQNGYYTQRPNDRNEFTNQPQQLNGFNGPNGDFNGRRPNNGNFNGDWNAQQRNDFNRPQQQETLNGRRPNKQENEFNGNFNGPSNNENRFGNQPQAPQQTQQFDPNCDQSNGQPQRNSWTNGNQNQDFPNRNQRPSNQQQNWSPDSRSQFEQNQWPPNNRQNGPSNQQRNFDSQFQQNSGRDQQLNGQRNQWNSNNERQWDSNNFNRPQQHQNDFNRPLPIDRQRNNFNNPDNVPPFNQPSPNNFNGNLNPNNRQQSNFANPIGSSNQFNGQQPSNFSPRNEPNPTLMAIDDKMRQMEQVLEKQNQQLNRQQQLLLQQTKVLQHERGSNQPPPMPQPIPINRIDNQQRDLPFDSTTPSSATCQLTTTQQQYCPRKDQQAVIQPQPCALVQGSATNARYQGICSWMLDPLACDPESRCHFLQCQPASNNLYCGRWQRMPCAPATVFDAAAQICVWDTSATPGPLPLPTPAPLPPTSTLAPNFQFNGNRNFNNGGSSFTTANSYVDAQSSFNGQFGNNGFGTNDPQSMNSQQNFGGGFQQMNNIGGYSNFGQSNSRFNGNNQPYSPGNAGQGSCFANGQSNQNLCRGGVQIGSCSSTFQCPGQSVCQIGQMTNRSPCTVCCYYRSMLMD
ncbi:hypothetical protein M3Y94_00956300 [Aphelenchoides besseyi]|nr:hypothetical protein M3Y94_00956300 [Aphelenchoides besseyi]KAI6224766.1 hypothetical protein M3Y95_00787100 [Aphelenchoides besseyi]